MEEVGHGDALSAKPVEAATTINENPQNPQKGLFRQCCAIPSDTSSGPYAKPTICNAAAITIDDLTDNITISWIGFDAFRVNALDVVIGTGPHAITVDEGAPLTFGGNWTPIAGQPAPPLTATSGAVAFLEVPVTGLLSDTLFVTFVHGPVMDGPVVVGPNQLRIAGSFVSDGETPVGAAPDVPRLVETGDYQFVQTQLGAPESLTVRVRSDVVPEPASLVLFASGTVGLVARRKRPRS